MTGHPHISDEERASGTVFIHSDVYEQPDGSYLWVVEHPGSGWSASGRAFSPVAATVAAQDAVRDALAPEDDLDERSVTAIRVHLDMPPRGDNQ